MSKDLKHAEQINNTYTMFQTKSVRNKKGQKEVSDGRGRKELIKKLVLEIWCCVL